MSPHPITNFQIKRCYLKEPKLNGVYSRNKLPKIRDGRYVINLDEYKSIGTYWIAFYVNGDNVSYFHSFGVKFIPKEILKNHREQK